MPRTGPGIFSITRSIQALTSLTTMAEYRMSRLADQRNTENCELNPAQRSLDQKSRMILFSPLFRFERSHIDREAVLHVGLEQSVVCFVHLLNGNHFGIGGDVVFATKVEHLLRLGNTADR